MACPSQLRRTFVRLAFSFGANSRFPTQDHFYSNGGGSVRDVTEPDAGFEALRFFVTPFFGARMTANSQAEQVIQIF